MSRLTHIIIYISFIGYVLLSQLIIFGYDNVNDELGVIISNLMQTCEKVSNSPVLNPDLIEKYYEN